MRDTVSRVRTSLRVLLESFPTLMAFLFDKEVGGAYGIGAREKFNLVRAFRRNAKAIEILSHGYEHLELAAAILRVPPDVEGDVVECGCYVGGSSVNLSLTCALVGRRLIICDSFEGLPEPAEHDREHPAPHVGHTDRYEEGMFAAGLDVVKANLGKHGDLSVCEFIVGFFEESLVGFNRPVVMGFLDVDLIDSLKPCLTGLWPNLADGCRLYVHEARSVSLVSIFFDAPWWRENLDADAPGFIGAGSGLPLRAPLGSEIGYAQRGIVASRVTAGT